MGAPPSIVGGGVKKWDSSWGDGRVLQQECDAHQDQWDWILAVLHILPKDIESKFL